MGVTTLLACPFCAEALSKREMLGFTISIFLLLGLLYGLASLVIRAMIREDKAKALREAAHFAALKSLATSSSESARS